MNTIEKLNTSPIRTASWANIGMDVSGAKDTNEVLTRSGLDFVVEQTPLQTESGLVVPGMVANVDTTNGKVLGVTSQKYHPIQNADAFDFVNDIGEGLEFVKSGMTQSGMVYMIARMPDSDILGDGITPYVCFRNSFNGRFPLTAAICPLRIVCQNQFNLAFKQSPNTVTIRHSSRAEERMREAQRVLRATSSHMDEMKAFAFKMARAKATDAQFSEVLDSLFPIPAEDASNRIKSNVEANRQAFITAYDADDNGNFRGSKWGMINAYADYLTHRPVQRKTAVGDENRFEAVSFDPKQMSQFVKLVDSI